MDINVYLFIVIALMLLIIMYLLFVLRRVRTQLALIKDALEDIKGGNLNRRILAGENDMTKTICYDINKIAVNSQAQLIRQRQSEQAYKRLMTSLSHDVKTPLASLVGYLEAVENKIVIGEEKDEYIHVAHEKAHYMKSFVENLFEWVKLDSGEQIFHFESFNRFLIISLDVLICRYSPLFRAFPALFISEESHKSFYYPSCFRSQK